MLSVQNVFVSPQGLRRDAEREKHKFSVEEGDHITHLNVYNSFIAAKQSSRWCASRFLDFKALMRAMNIRNQLKRWAQSCGLDTSKSCGEDTEKLRKCVLAGFFSQTAQLGTDGVYRSVRNKNMVKK
jgi:ATP-dependent RNA helicase DDX35